MRLAAIGSNCIDFYKNLEGGKPFPGGGPVNMAVYTIRLGGSGSYIGPVGTDDYGKVQLEAMKAKGVDCSHVSVLEGKTAVTTVELVNGDRKFTAYDQGVLADFTLSDEELRFIAENHDMVVSDQWGKIAEYYPKLQKMGIPTAYDCSTRVSSPSALSVMPHCDYLFFSADDGDCRTLRELMKLVHSMGPKLVIAMLGEEGSLCFDGKDFHKCGIVPCENLVDTLGAGDSFISGFLFGICEGLSIEEAMYKGAANATETLKYFGAW